MWVRLQFDIGPADLAAGLAGCLFSMSHSLQHGQAVSVDWAGQAWLPCLSVRSGVDLLLQAQRWSAGREVLLSALTVPDMPRIVTHHGLVPVPVDLVPNGCMPALDSLQRACTEGTRAMIVAHLFGMRIDMQPIVDLAHRRGLFVIEDCAQSYEADAYPGHPDSDAVLFSFGPIKTATALGGGLLRVRDPELARRIRGIQAAYPVQSRWSVAGRLLRYTAMKALSHPWPYAWISRGCHLAGMNQDDFVSGAARNFPPDRLFERLPQQPAVALVHLLQRRLATYSPQRIAQRRERGEALRARLHPATALSQEGAVDNTYWVFPILVDDPVETVQRLRQAGLDATCRTRLAIVGPPPTRPDLEPDQVRRLLEHLVFLPWHARLPQRAVDRMVDVLSRSHHAHLLPMTPAIRALS